MNQATRDPHENEILVQVNAARGELATTMGLEFTRFEPGRLEATLPVQGNRQPYGQLHGGASAVLAETLGSVAASLHAAGSNRRAVGVELNATHHRAVSHGRIAGVCTPLHEGSSSATYAIDITDEDGRRICSARLSCRLLETRSSELPAPGHP
jgi:uncharacterized protein (TIGR00369 family)